MIENVIIVDDEPLNLIILRKYLEALNVPTVYEFEDSSEALHFLENASDIDMLITDYQMPKMNGAELMKRVRNVTPDLPIFLVTAFEYNYVHEKEKLEDEFMRKPLSLDIFRILFERYNKE